MRDDLISRQAVLEAIDNERKSLLDMGMKDAEHIVVHHARRIIEELPSVTPAEKSCRDAISRQAVLDLLFNSYIKTELTSIGNASKEYAELCVNELKELPPVNQEPKIGHWIDDEFGSKCSCCNIYTHLDKFDRPMKFRYCSMCGARMNGKEDE